MILEGGIIGAIIGAGGSLIGNYLTYKKEMAMMEHTEKMARINHDHAIKEYEQKAGDEAHARIIEHDKTLDGGWLINGLRASVRPVITYICFTVFLLILFSIFNGWFPEVLTATQELVVATFIAITNATIMFWFTDRALEKARRWAGATNV